jgi:short-subunit dehydrogenase
VSADLWTAAGAEALLARAASLDIELLVHNAGGATYGPFASTPVERARELLRFNVEEAAHGAEGPDVRDLQAGQRRQGDRGQ